MRRAADGLSFPATLEGVAVLERKYIPNIVSFFLNSVKNLLGNFGGSSADTTTLARAILSELLACHFASSVYWLHPIEDDICHGSIRFTEFRPGFVFK